MLPMQPRGGRREDHMLPPQDELAHGIKLGKRGARHELSLQDRIAREIEAWKRGWRPCLLMHSDRSHSLDHLATGCHHSPKQAVL